MNIVPKLDLNMSPQTVDNGSLVFARNMKIDDDGCLISDYGYKDISALSGYNVVGHIVGLDDKIYFFCYSDNTSKVLEYDENNETVREISCNWNYSGGVIDGYVSTNISGEKILTIAETSTTNDSIPLKHINLSFCKSDDDESIYSQAPKCPTANLILKGTYVKTIPNGVYLFFIRYKIRKDVYTNWFVCSRPIFGGTSEKITTLQGGLQYINLHKDSAKSFVLQLDFPITSNISSYKEFQLGFIISHDDAVDARMWKHFTVSNFKTSEVSDADNLIYFDYEDVKEANIDDLLEDTYEIYNVGNVTSFKNKLYISNYLESNFNPSEIDDDVNGLKNFITLQEKHTGGSDIEYRNMLYNGIKLKYDDEKGYYSSTKSGASIKDQIYQSHFNYDITKLAKESSKEKSDVVRFDIFWNGSIDPDIALVYNIYNDLYNKVIFGDDDETPIPDSYSDSDKIARVGLKLIDSGKNAYIYGPVSNNNASNHPWYNLGFTFGFGSYKANEVGTPNYKLGCSVFNAQTYNFEYSNIAGHDSSKRGWFSRDSGFGDFARSTIENTMQREIEGRSFFAKAYLEVSSGAKTYLIGYKEYMDLDNYAGYNMKFNIWNDSGGSKWGYQNAPYLYYEDNDLEILNPDYFSTTAVSTSLSNKIKKWIFDAIQATIVGIDESGAPVLDLSSYGGEKNVRANSIAVKFKKFDFKLDNEDIDTTSGKYVKRFKVSMTTTDYTSLCTFSFKNKYVVVSDTTGDMVQTSTLMPLSTYQPYIHFVDEHNIITNGAKLPKFTTGIAKSDTDVISLQYKRNGSLASAKYKAFFISLVNVGDIVIEGFNYGKDPNSNTTNILHCVEIDTLLYNLNDNITIKVYNNDGTIFDTVEGAKYYSSGSNYPPLAFGNCGYISWENSKNYAGKKFYIIIERNKTNENINNLVKSSGYIPFNKTTEDYTDLVDGYYGSWLSLVKKPSFELSSSCYVSGKDVYAVNRTTALSLTEFKSFIQVQNSVTYFVRSNFNLNYLSLTEDINDSIFTVGTASSGVKQVAKIINSAILSFIYELKGMYRDFSNKYFRAFDKDYKIDFQNTIRVSHVLSDETFNNSIFKFDPADYYNVPTDRGIIVNLFSIGNNIFVHTESSFYKFDGNQTIATSGEDISLQESEPFDVGVSQLFDSEYGYGGIKNKEAGCITYDSYVFYDASSNHIFAYSGNGQVQLIDAAIYKLLCYYKPKFCRTLHDDSNHRILFEFLTYVGSNGKYTISYNYKMKSFVSIHDITLEKTLHSRRLSYSYKSGVSVLFDTTSPIDVSSLNDSLNTIKLYGNASSVSDLQFGSDLREKQYSPFNIAVVMFPKTAITEVIDNLSYIGSVKEKDDISYARTGDLFYKLMKSNQVSKTNPVKAMFIITNRCVSDVVDSDVDEKSAKSYKGFKFELGKWNSNYFRNALNIDDTYKYDATGTSDNRSLVYGRYFIIVFNFIKNLPIKFEEIYINTSKY